MNFSIRIKFLIIICIAMSTLLLLIYFINSTLQKSIVIESNSLSKIPSNINKTIYYEFIDSSKAFHLLSLFDRNTRFIEEYLTKNKSQKIFYGIIKDDQYCRRSREYFAYHTKNLFKRNHIFTDYPHNSLLRKHILPKIGIDTHPNIYKGMLKKDFQVPLFNLSPEISIYFLISGIHKSNYGYEIGKNFGCSTQMYNYIYGSINFDKKYQIAQTYKKYIKLYTQKDLGHCVKKFMPDSYFLKNKVECNEFFKYINSTIYQKQKIKHNYVFFKKVDKTKFTNKTIYLMDDKLEYELRNEYQNGTLCGENKNYTLMEKYVFDPLLYKGYKFDVRTYVLIASTDPLIVYYHDGYIILSKLEYDANSTSRLVHISNEILNNSNNSNELFNVNISNLQTIRTISYASLNNYLLRNKKIKDVNWIENHLKKQIKSIIIHIIRMKKHNLLKKSSLFELLNFDFLIDNHNLKVWFIGLNNNPKFEIYNTNTYESKVITKLLIDQFELIYGLIKSKLKRIIMFINEIIKEIDEYYDENDRNARMRIKNYGFRKRQFYGIIKNHMEPEFDISPRNTFEKIIDLNLHGIDSYNKFIYPECLQMQNFFHTIALFFLRINNSKIQKES